MEAVRHPRQEATLKLLGPETYRDEAQASASVSEFSTYDSCLTQCGGHFQSRHVSNSFYRSYQDITD